MRPTVNKLNKVIKVFTRGWQGIAGAQGIQGAVGPADPYRTVKTIVFTDSPYTVTTADSILLVDATAGAVTVNLLTSTAAMTGSNGLALTITKIDTSSNNVTVDGDGAEKVVGELTQTLSGEQDSLTIIPDGSNWHKNG